MSRILIGNIISLAAALTMALIGLIKSRKKILAAQCLQFGLYAAGNLVLGATTGALTNLLSIVRNVLCIKKGFALWEKIVFSAVLAGLSVAVNRAGLIGWLPTVSVVMYTFVVSVKSEVKLKLCIIVSQFLWMIYDWHFQGYVSFVFDIITVISTVIGIWRVLKDRKEQKIKTE